jgi:hypothetical protein
MKPPFDFEGRLRTFEGGVSGAAANGGFGAVNGVRRLAAALDCGSSLPHVVLQPDRTGHVF